MLGAVQLTITKTLCFQGLLSEIPPAHLSSVPLHGPVSSQHHWGLVATCQSAPTQFNETLIVIAV